jgi:hypothetical protein
MTTINPHRTGVVLGSFLALWHTLWAVLVFIGAAQWLIDFIFRLHMIAPPYRITGFNLLTAASLVLVTAFIGYLSGLIVGLIWNRCARQQATEATK